MKRLLFALWALSALTTAYADNLVINEVMASNAGVAMSPATNFDSWIEIYNPNTTAVNLSGMHLSNNPDNLTRWKMGQMISRATRPPSNWTAMVVPST